ncbi:MAG: YggS family pyridoxal phosphate-dependent enzyme [Planctomycetaceae bacterium]|nr:YggS family pyridoxal phosphate-dependent enzyme [Planctomycetaceae bacterium]
MTQHNSPHSEDSDLSAAEIRQIVGRNLATIHHRMQQAVELGKHSVPDPQLIAVTKYAEPAWVNALIELGVRKLAESRPQQLQQRRELWQSVEDLEWHLIGHLQRNKVRSLLQQPVTIHSVDSWKLLEKISQISREIPFRPRVLIELNMTGESQKTGMPLHEFAEGRPMQPFQESCQIIGLMTMGLDTEDPELLRKPFRELRELRDRIASPDCPLTELSMGMSGDYEFSIQEGATMIRIGSSLFEGLDEVRASVPTGPQ